MHCRVTKGAIHTSGVNHRVPDLFNPKATIDALTAYGNTAYTEVRDAFYQGPVEAGWDVRDNSVAPYAAPPGGFLE